MAARVCAPAKFPKSLQMDFTSQLPVTSGHCTVCKNLVKAGQKHSYAPLPIASLSKWISGCVLHAVEKTFLAAQPIQLIALASPKHIS